MKKIIIICIFIINFKSYSEEKYFIPFLNINNISDSDKNFDKIFSDVFNYNFDIWKEEFKNEINLNKKKNDILKIKKLEENKIIEEINMNKYLDILKSIYDLHDNSISYAEACFKLSLFYYVNKKNEIEKSINYLNDGLKVNNLSTANKKLFVKMNLLLGSILISNEKFSMAKKIFNEIIKLKLDKNIFCEEIIRAYIGIGDSEFELFQFNNAHTAYKNSLLTSNYLDGINDRRHTELIGEIKLRLIWSSYRNADYKLSLEYIKYFLRERENYVNLFPEKILDDIIRIGAMSLYETKDINKYKEFSLEKVAGDFAKSIIIYSFYSSISYGNSFDVERIAKSIESQFYFSILFPDFIKVRLLALNKANNHQTLNNLAYYATAYIANNSLWRSKFKLSDIQEKNRRSLIYDYSMQSGKYFYDLGIATKSKMNFLKSAEIYYSRIQENYADDSRGYLFQLYAQSLMMAGDLNLAWNASEESFRYSLKKDELKISWYQLVRISRLQSQDTTNTKSDEFIKYEKAVDGYIMNFPLDLEARLSFFECAKRAELLNDYKNAAERYEKLMSMPSLYFKEQDQEEKDKVSLALANLYLKIGGNEKNVSDAASSLEKFSFQNKISEMVNKVIITNNYNLALEYANKLKKNGELINSAKFLELWAKNNEKNVNAANVLVLAIKECATLQNWEYVQILCNYFIKNFQSNVLLHEVIFWQARSSDKLLQFSRAAFLYNKSSDINNLYPLNKDKEFALSRAAEIYRMLQLNEYEATALEKLSVIKSNLKKNSNEIAGIELVAAQKYFLVNNYSLSKKMYQKIINKINIKDEIMESAKIGILLVDLYSIKKINKNIIKNNFDKHIKNILSSYNTFKFQDIIKESIGFINNYEKNEFNEESGKNISNININKLKIILNSIKIRAEYLRKYDTTKKSFEETCYLLGNLSSKIAEIYKKFYMVKNKNDKYLIEENLFNNDSKKYLYDAFYNVDNNSKDFFILSTLLNRYSNSYFKVTPKAEMQIEQSSSDILDHLNFGNIN